MNATMFFDFENHCQFSLLTNWNFDTKLIIAMVLVICGCEYTFNN